MASSDSKFSCIEAMNNDDEEASIYQSAAFSYFDKHNCTYRQSKPNIFKTTTIRARLANF